MKPREFDELIKTKYDQGDFAYNPRNWERLAEQLDEKPNKSRMLLWLPMAAVVSFSSIAASLAMIISLPALVHHKQGPAVAAMHKAAVQQSHYTAPAPVAAATLPPVAITYNYTAFASKNIAAYHYHEANPIEDLLMGVHSRQLLENTINKNLHLAETLLSGVPDAAHASQKGNVNMFAYSDRLDQPEQEKKTSRSAISVLGGINHGAQSAGYTIGFAAKTMISKNMYIEGDVAFVNNSNPGKTEYTVSNLTPTAKLATTTKQLGISGTATDEAAAATPVTVSKPTSFGIYYAQFTPSVGYNIRNRISVGVGADMQQLLQNTATSTPDVSSDKIVPQFDMGLVGKTEYTLTSRIKAGVYYRRGITNVLMTTDRYVDRNYMQVQVKYTIFNR